MATATYKVVSVEIMCPKCGDVIPEPTSGSLFWTTNEFDHGEHAECPNGHAVKLPKVSHT